MVRRSIAFEAEMDPIQTSDPTPKSASGGKAVWDWTGRQLRQLWNYLRATVAFYWKWRGDLRIGARRWLLQYLPALEDPDRVRREIRVPLLEGDQVTLEDDAWAIQLPGRCVVCGNRGSGERIHFEREMLDPFPLLAAPLAGALLALFFGWWYQSLLLVLVLLPGGMLAGFAVRRVKRLIVLFERCARHAKSEKVPEVELWRGEAFLWTGAREVRQAFFGQLVEDASPEEADVPYVPPELTPSPPVETLALADDVPESSRIVHESAEKLSTSESENDLFGSLNESLDSGGHTERPAPGEPGSNGGGATGSDLN
jgi:hypothetical protein